MSHGLALLRILSDGRFHSGEDLGSALGVGRAAVWKCLQGLRAGGMEIQSVPGRGYRLASALEPLSEETILGALPASVRARLGGLELHYELDSTNSALLRRAAALPPGTVCLAEMQHAGRGRRGRNWVSPCARNLYLSLLWRFPRGPDALAGLALVVGLAALRALEDEGVRGAAVKWPNDIVWQGAKLAGALIELSGESGGSSCVVIGIGINVDMPGVAAGNTMDDAIAVAIGQRWTDARTAAGAPVSRNRLAAGVLHRLCSALDRFQAGGLVAFMDEWRARDALRDRAVTVELESGGRHGIARGVDAGGALLVEENGVLRAYHSGDVSVRAHATSPGVNA
jgi:BirA family biotin operon repressor/biotin-[acetyl-CoA-carboxylase] ligase